jgi:anti-sigma regulatory factor (Ser/Thr protein kinase)
MRRVIPVPPTLDDEGFDALVAELEKGADDSPVLLDARHLRWADPYGMVGLLAIGQRLQGPGSRPILQLPESGDVAGYMARMGFQKEAEGLFEIHGAGQKRREGAASNVLLEITPIRSHEDVHSVIDHVQERAGVILTERLGYSRGDASMFSMILSEVCQNIIEHAEAGGWVGIQTYNWAKRLGRQVVVIAVMDLGIGFRGSLAREHSVRYGDRWSDATALEAAFMHGTTRFRDPGRGQGLKQIRTRVLRWGGKVSIRSGTARIADIPDWDDAPPLEQSLAPFPGSQILIVLPERSK